MKVLRLVVLILAVATVGAQQQGRNPALPAGVEAYPGQNDHKEPPEGWHCMPQSPTFTVPPDHVCACSRHTIVHAEDGSCVKNNDGTDYIIEDPKCSVFCHKSHCQCPAESCDT